MTRPAAQTACAACGAEVARSLSTCPRCSAPVFAPQRRVVSVLFADLAGYTQLCSEMDAEDVHLLIRPVMNALCQVCQTLGGVVPGIAGDGLMAVFGARHAHEHDPLRAVVAAARLQRLVQERRAAYPRLPELRVGVNTGEVIVAPSWEPGGFSVSGDVVNVGQRLCAAAPPGGVLVSAEAARLAPGITAWAEEQPQLLHKRTALVPARSLDWAAVPERLSTARLPSAVPLVGRTAELSRLDALLQAPPAGAALAVIGEPGVGKTRLVEEWTRRHPELRLLATSCPSFGGNDLAPLRDLVVAALAEPDADAAVRQLPPLIQRRVRHLVAGPGRSEPDEEEALVAAATALLVALGALRPTVVTIDDAHWARGPVIDAIAPLAAASGPALAVIATSRTDGGALRGLPQLVVRPVPDADAVVIAERCLPGAPEELQRFVLTRAGGNPLFIEQCSTLLVEDGTVTVDDDGCHIASPAGLATARIPTSMRLFVAARLDLLEPAERAALAAAATLGDVVELDALAHLAPDARTAVDGLVERGYLRWGAGAEAGARTLGFSHAVVRDVAYAAQTRGARRTAHEENADWYARRTDLDGLELRATHLEAALALATDTGDECDLVGAAFEALVAQAETGMVERLRGSRSALARARRLLEGHQQCALDPFRFWLATAHAASIGGDAEAALRAAAEARTLAAERGAIERAEAELARADGLYSKVDTVAASGAYGAARSMFVAAGDRVGEARAALGQAHCAEVSNGLREAVVALRNARDVAVASGARTVALVAAQELALLSYIDGPVAVASALRATEALLDDDDELGQAWVSLAKACVTLHGLDAPTAVRHATDAVRRSTDIGDANASFNGLLLLLEAEVLDGQVEAAGATLARCLDLAAARPTRRMHVSATLIGALLDSRRGEPEAAIAAIDGVSRDVDALGLAFQRDRSAFRGYVALERGYFAEAIDEALAAVTLDAVLDQPFLSLRPRLAGLAACVGMRLSPADDANDLRADAAQMGATEIDALAARWLAQDALLRGHAPTEVPSGPDLVEARALDLENDALRTHDPAGFGAAADAWSELGATVWQARALLWHAEAAGDESSATEGAAVLERIGADPGLAASLRADLTRAWSS